MLSLDVALLPVALALSLAIQTGERPRLGSYVLEVEALAMLMLVAGLLSYAMGLHRIQLKAYEIHAMRLTGVHAIVIAGVTAILDGVTGYATPPSTFIVFAMIYFILGASCRLLLLQVVLGAYRRGNDQLRVVIYGAGRTGQQLAAAFTTDMTIKPIAFVDDNANLQSTIVQGLRVHSPLVLPRLMEEKRADRVLLAMPSVPRSQLTLISRRLSDLGIDVLALPSFAQLAGSGAPLVSQLRPVAPGTLLGRAPLDAELPGGSAAYQGRSVLVSGGGGSIGSELCRQLLVCRPRRVVIVESSELALYQITMELEALVEGTQVEIVSILGSVCDAALMRRVLRENAVEIVLHAAAYKHVPIVQRNPIPGFQNNVIGTQTLAQAAMETGVARFILVSTDKAVRPRNLMGASKRLAELVVQDLARRARDSGAPTVYSMVRFGNVLGSSGSVIPLFTQQIRRGGPITVTDREVTRYFMTIPEAARLVLAAGSFAEGGEVFVLDMGEPISIYALARQLVESANLTVKDESNPDGDIEIRFTGLRPGEKLHEELLIGTGQVTTPHPKIMLAREGALSEIEVAAAIKALRAAIAEADDDALRAVVSRYVEGGAGLLQPKAELALS
nr:nucleoside-diphosphate sugar epimerase/dehydratase [Wenxinia saemankumensis]